MSTARRIRRARTRLAYLGYSRAENRYYAGNCDSSPFTGPLGEGDDGYLYAPSWTRDEWWDRRLRVWRPTHWLPWLRYRLTRKVVWLEVTP